MSRVVTAATRPLHLLAPGVGIAAAGGLLAVGLPPLAVAVGALSLGTWAALTGWELVQRPPAPPPPPDPASELRAPDLRERLRAVLDAAARVTAHVHGHEGVLDGTLAELEAEQQELVTAATSAARRADKVWLLLGAVDPAALQREVEERRAAARAARDPEVARPYEEAADAKERELATWRSLARLLERARAELVAAEAALDELRARVARLMLEDPGVGLGGDIRAQVRSLSERLHGVERAVDDTLRELG